MADLYPIIEVIPLQLMAYYLSLKMQSILIIQEILPNQLLLNDIKDNTDEDKEIKYRR